MIGYYRRHLVDVTSAARWWRYWLHRRPLLVGSASVIALLVLILWFGAAPAFATDAATSVDDLTDSYGAPAAAYSVLPVSDGGPFSDVGTKFNQWLVTFAWSVSHQFSLAILSSFIFILDFDWVQWLALPISGLAAGIGLFVRDASWVQIALALSGLVGGLYIMRGRHGTGWLEVGTSATAAALLVGVLANPTEWLVGEGGALDTVSGWGREVATIVATGEISGQQYTLSAVAAQPLVDLIIRQPYQFVAFNHELTGDCADVLTSALQSSQSSDGAYTRDQVRGCDAAAAEYADHPRPEMFGSLGISVLARSLIQLPMGIGLLILECTIVFILVDSLKLLPGLFLAMFPVNRRLALTAGFGMLMGLLSMLVQIVLIVAFATAAVEIQSSASAHIPYAELQFVSAGVFFGLLVVLVMTVWQMRQRSKLLAEKAATLGSSAMPPVRALPVAAAVAGAHRAVHMASSLATSKKVSDAVRTQTPQQVAFFTNYYNNHTGTLPHPTPQTVQQPPQDGPRPSTPAAPPSGLPGGPERTQEPMQGTFTKPPSKPAPKLSTTQRAARAIDVGVRVARVAAAGAASGGTAAVTQGAKELGSMTASATLRRVQVDPRTGVASITSLPAVPKTLPPAAAKQPTAASLAMRRELEAAKKAA